MKLQTQIPLKQEQHNLIDYNAKLLLLGSCFSENIGKKFTYFKFQSLVNPFGILFHPQAMETVVENAIDLKEYTDKDVFFHNEQWHCFDVHSKLSNASKTKLLEDLNTTIQTTNKQLAKATHIIITLGTAWVYKYIETNTIVANCHKVPQKSFTKQLLTVDEILVSLKNIVSKINQVNANTSVIFTVSPVRHIKDGFIENTLSKSHLITAIHQLLSLQEQSLNVTYFPSYEIMLDELRDYRFYKEDMLHPNKLAVSYIWNKFQQVWISNEAKKTMQEIDTIQKGLLHKPFNPKAKAHLQFLDTLEQKIQSIKAKHGFVSF
ncbi:GSCFA domain-containing protein [Lacinutrix sp. C3R15]|uniref:GSCFA domain-containing protein n=1 Tax=Flavobacteriaceae TaxID=49546 RepID=UPI001C0A4A48|nr:MULTISPECIES: GSCFA domain-containing protein [Flavobacteriaceae]MBU2939743.1 GSCFA domain-containing protein [Lacinutrix sp. C3R15]MDO6623058.1 GSCFA domain-containing protein [Oceanihabitans sp. 1_MG-2023]